MSGMHHRAPGVVGASLTCDGTFCELIADESHVGRVAADVLLRARKWQEVALVTDCLSAAATPDGKGYLGEMQVVARGHVCYLAGRHMLAGTTITLLDVAKNIGSWGIVKQAQALRMASEVPARSVGRFPELGSISVGARADLIVLNKRYKLRAVFSDGIRLT